MSTPVFHHVTVIVSPVTGYYTIEWRLAPQYKFQTDSVAFYVECTRSGSGEWIRLNPLAPVTDRTLYVDQTRYRVNVKNDLFYRVVMVDGTVTVSSAATGVNGGLTNPERRMAAEILRKKYLQMRKRTGTPGYLLRKKEWGTVCTCIDKDTGAVPTPSCPLCFGSGISGGYYAPVPFFLEFAEQSGVKEDRDDVTSAEMIILKKAMCVFYPTIWPYDVWVAAETGERYLVYPEMKPSVFIRSTFLISEITLEQLPPDRPQYQIPITYDQLSGPSGWGEGISLLTDRNSVTPEFNWLVKDIAQVTKEVTLTTEAGRRARVKLVDDNGILTTEITEV